MHVRTLESCLAEQTGAWMALSSKLEFDSNPPTLMCIADGTAVAE